MGTEHTTKCAGHYLIVEAKAKIEELRALRRKADFHRSLADKHRAEAILAFESGGGDAASLLAAARSYRNSAEIQEALIMQLAWEIDELLERQFASARTGGLDASTSSSMACFRPAP